MCRETTQRGPASGVLPSPRMGRRQTQHCREAASGLWLLGRGLEQAASRPLNSI